MSQAPPSERLNLWQPVRIEQAEFSECFLIDASADDINIGRFIAHGHYDVERPPRHRGVRLALRASDGLLQNGLWGYLSLALLDLGVFKRDHDAAVTRVFCHRAVALPGGQRIGLLCSLVPLHEDELPLPEDTFADVANAVAHFDAAMAADAMDEALRKVQDVNFLEGVPLEQRGVYQKAHQFRDARPRPIFNLTPFVAAFPHGLMVKLPSFDPDVVERNCRRAVTQYPDDHHPPPRDGWYEAVVASANPKQRRAMVTWVAHRGAAPYPEVRAAAERRLPRAFQKPRRADPTPPEIDDGISTIAPDNIRRLLFDPAALNWLDDDFKFEFEAPEEVARTAKAQIRQHGFDCIGWYLPHHFYTEDTWGIYIDAPKLDEAACSIAEDLRAGGVRRGRNALAGKLALMLVYRHELFHAKVEAAFTWMELQALQPKFLPYKAKVFNALKGTDDHLEEALANFASWVWASADAVVQQLTGQLGEKDRRLVEKVVRWHLDLSPPGYRRWEEGNCRETWRVLATQMVQGKPKLFSRGIGLPIESLLREALSFDFDEWHDVPCRFVGEGRIASSLFAAPATLNLPSRREVRKVIRRHFGYELVPGAGKGSHEKFRHLDGHIFALPLRDPVSMTVFQSFLSHFKLSKAEYDRLRHRA
ncbi:hypothetical protein [Piscinibacter sakaiensis]|uniref:hypothetical protein n=1 Tax=Piscinibacter sakaiensis TaxID=1547922 RepID=UPI003AAF2A4F